MLTFCASNRKHCENHLGQRNLLNMFPFQKTFFSFYISNPALFTSMFQSAICFPLPRQLLTRCYVFRHITANNC